MRIKNGLNTIVDNSAKLKKAFERLASKDVMVGIPSEKTERKEDSGMNNAAIGYIMEHGAPEMNLPARPFLIPGVRAVKDKVTTQFKLAAKKSMAGDVEAVNNGLNRAGMVAQNSVRATINSGIAPSLAPSTLAARRKRGRTGTVPLIDTGQLRNSITYILKEK
jgi:phage gpG-like protein